MSPETELAGGLHGAPSAEPTFAYRLVRALLPPLARFVGFRIVVEGLAHMPQSGPYVVAGLPHRVWVDPFLLWGYLPVRPRLSFFGDAATMSRSPLRRAVIGAVGGVIPIPTGHERRNVEAHLAGAHAVLAVGGAFCLFPETGPASAPGELRRLGAGVGYVALRDRAPIVPVVIGGNDELFRGRTLIVRVLPPLDPFALAGVDARPEPGSKEEREAVRRLLVALADATAPAVMAAHRDALPPAGMPRRWAFLHTLFR